MLVYSKHCPRCGARPIQLDVDLQTASAIVNGELSQALSAQPSDIVERFTSGLCATCLDIETMDTQDIVDEVPW